MLFCLFFFMFGFRMFFLLFLFLDFIVFLIWDGVECGKFFNFCWGFLLLFWECFILLVYFLVLEFLINLCGGVFWIFFLDLISGEMGNVDILWFLFMVFFFLYGGVLLEISLVLDFCWGFISCLLWCDLLLFKFLVDF